MKVFTVLIIIFMPLMIFDQKDTPTYTMVEGSANICKWIIALDQLGIKKATW